MENRLSDYAVKVRNILDEIEPSERALREYDLTLDEEENLAGFEKMADAAYGRAQNIALKLARMETPVESAELRQTHEALVNGWQDKMRLYQMMLNAIREKQGVMLPEYFLQLRQIDARLDEALYETVRILERNRFTTDAYQNEYRPEPYHHRSRRPMTDRQIRRSERRHQRGLRRASRGQYRYATVNKNTAALFAFFLGWCGVHRFMMGRPTSGILYAVFSMTGIPAILAFFDTISLLLMREEAYNEKYGYVPKEEREYSAD